MATFLDRLSIGRKIIGFNLLSLAVLMAAVSATVYHLTLNGMMEQAHDRLEEDIAVAWQVLRPDPAAEITVADGRLLVGGRDVAQDHAVVDKISALVHASATIFVGDTRLSTTVKKADGTRAVGTQLAPGPVHDAVLKARKPYRGEADILGQRYLTAYDPILDKTGAVVGILYVGLNEAGYLAVVHELLLDLGIAATLAFLVVGLGSRLIIGRIASQLQAIQRRMQTLSQGNLDAAIPCTGRVDEIGGMARSLEVFRQNALDRLRLEAEQRDTEERAAQERRQALLDMAVEMERTVQTVVEDVARSAERMRQTAGGIAHEADGLSGRSDDVASGAQEANASVQTVAAATEELAASIAEIGRQAAHSLGIVGAALDRGERSRQNAAALSDATAKIAQVVELIQHIANQTNLLALNATIEAARAGDAGKGFAVVAGEVKNLAAQTEKATQEIGTLIASVQQTSTQTVGAIEEITQAISGIHEIASTIASAVEQQNAATSEISTNTERAAQGVQLVSEGIEEVSSIARQNGKGAHEVQDSAEALGTRAMTLQNEVRRFLEHLRAA